MNSNKHEGRDIAAEILNQINVSYSGTVSIKTKTAQIDAIGFKALDLLGAHNFLYDKNSVQFAIKGNKDFNKIVIKLNEQDLYDIELWNCKIINQDPYIINDKIDEYNDVEASELGNLIIKEAIH